MFHKNFIYLLTNLIRCGCSSSYNKNCSYYYNIYYYLKIESSYRIINFYLFNVYEPKDTTEVEKDTLKPIH